MAAIELGKHRQLATMGLRPDISFAESIFNYKRSTKKPFPILSVPSLLMRRVRTTTMALCYATINSVNRKKPQKEHLTSWDINF